MNQFTYADIYYFVMNVLKKVINRHFMAADITESRTIINRAPETLHHNELPPSLEADKTAELMRWLHKKTPLCMHASISC